MRDHLPESATERHLSPPPGGPICFALVATLGASSFAAGVLVMFAAERLVF